MKEKIEKLKILEDAEDDDLKAKRYQQVHKLYRVGCRACMDPNFHAYLYEECKKKSKEANSDSFLTLLQNVENEMFPSTGISNGMDTKASDTNMDIDKSREKRSRQPNSDDESPEKKTVCNTHHGNDKVVGLPS